MTRRGVLQCVILGGALGASAPALGQQQANVSAVYLEVKLSKRSLPAWQDAKKRDRLAKGDHLRTGRYAKAGVVSTIYSPEATLKVDEFSEISLSGNSLAAAHVVSGGLLGMFNKFGSITGPRVNVNIPRPKVFGGLLPERMLPVAEFSLQNLRGDAACDIGRSVYAASAPGGNAPAGAAAGGVETQVEYRFEGNTTTVRCYSGLAYVGVASPRVHAGTADDGTATTLVDQELIGRTRDIVGATLQLRSGPNEGQVQTIIDFDPATGTVTVGAAFGAPIGPDVEYMVSTEGDFGTALPAGTEVTVHGDGPIPQPRPAFPATFPGGEEHRWWDVLVDGEVLKVYPGSAFQETVEDRDWPFVDPGVLKDKPSAPLPPVGGARVIVASAGNSRPSASGPRTASVSTSSGSGAGLDGLPLLAAVGTQAAGSGGTRTGPRTGVVLDFSAYTIGSDDGETEGSRTRLRGISRRVLAEVGGLARRFRGDDRVNLSEASLLYRSGQWGDFKVGRQHLFLGPVNNSRLGTLMDFNTADAAVWSGPPGHRLGWRVGYIYDNAPLGGEGISGWFGRGQGILGQGLWGFTLLTANRAGGGLGGSADLSLPLVPDQLNGYVEAGSDPFDRNLLTSGLYFPSLLQRANVNIFLEYQQRQGQEDSMSLRVSSEIASNWLVVGYLVQELGGSTTGGVGLRYRRVWH